MAASSYIRSALSQLHNAIGALEDDVRQIERKAYNDESQLQHDADRDMTEAHILRATEYVAKDDGAKRQIEDKEKHLEADAAMKKRNSEQEKADTSRIAQTKQGVINVLHSTIGELERVAGSAD